MKHFKIIGPKTTKEFDIEDDEMIQWIVIKMVDYESGAANPIDYPAKNEVAYDNG